MKQPLSVPKVAAAWAAVLIAVAVLTAWVASRSYFFADDLLFFQLSTEQRFGFDLLTRSAFGHLIPGFHAVNYGFVELFGFRYGPAVVILVVLWVGCAALVGALAKAAGADRRLALLLVAWFGISITGFHSAIWWAAALCLFPSTLFNLTAFALALRWERERRWSQLALGALSYLAACLFWEKSILLLVYIGAYLVIVADHPLSLRARVRSASGRWPLWITYGIVGGGYLVAYQLSGYAREAGPPAEASEVVRFLGVAWSQGLWPATIGLTVPGFRLFGSTAATIVAGQVVVVALVVASVRRRTVRCCVFFAFCFLVNMVVVARARAASFGPQLGHDLRYQFDDLLLLALAVAAHRAAPTATRRTAPARAHVAPTRPTARRAREVVAVVAAVVVVAVVAVRAGSNEVAVSQGAASRRFFDTYRMSLATGPAHPVLLDRVVPAPVSVFQFYPYSLASKAMALADAGPTFASDVAEPFVTFDDTGRVGPGRFVPTEDLGGAACSGPSGGDVRLDPAQPLPFGAWVLRLVARSDAPVAVDLRIVDEHGGDKEGRAGQVSVIDSPSPRVLITALAPSAVGAVVVRTTGAVCIDQGGIGGVALAN